MKCKSIFSNVTYFNYDEKYEYKSYKEFSYYVGITLINHN